jgi:ubiquinone/menaquinone biosynthesis C-methylase UbiE
MSRALLTQFMMQAPYQPATNYWRSVEIEEVIKYGFPQGKGLDLGCGDGHLMDIIVSSVGHRELIGVDIDPSETSLARKRNLYQEVFTAPGDQLPFPDGSFDFVFSNSVLEHIKPIDAVIGEVSRVLRPEGCFLFTVPGPNFHECLNGPRNHSNRERYLKEIDARCFHLRYWSSEEWVQHLEKAGLRITRQREYLSAHQVRRWERIASLTSGVLYKFGKKRKQPIEIQRQLGIRKSSIRMPRFLASACASILDSGSEADVSPCGCLLVEATR